jgi:hypothetical protein
MAGYKKCFVSENEIERMLEESGSEGGDDVFSERKLFLKVKEKMEMKVKIMQKKMQ